jgi:hypothetical protein
VVVKAKGPELHGWVEGGWMSSRCALSLWKTCIHQQKTAEQKSQKSNARAGRTIEKSGAQSNKSMFE